MVRTDRFAGTEKLMVRTNRFDRAAKIAIAEAVIALSRNREAHGEH